MALASTTNRAVSALAQRYLDVRQATAQLCAPLSAEDQMVQSMPEASPAKWHQAHTTWFFETFVLANERGYQPFDADFRFLFNSYYKQLSPGTTARGPRHAFRVMGCSHPQRSVRGSFSRPSLEKVKHYRQHVDEAVVMLLDSGAPSEVLDLVELGLNHEQQHQELILTDIKHAFWRHPLRPAYLQGELPAGAPQTPLQWIPFRGGVVTVGREGEGFSFDNETPRHDVLLPEFRIASRLATNGDYLDFLRDGGYARPELWLSDGWDRVCEEGWRAPLYWEEQDGAWHEFTLFGMKPVDAARPVCHVSYYEADAFARWAGARLATEFEWEAAAGEQSVVGNFLESGWLHPVASAASGGEQRVAALFGDCWEWTASAYSPYPGYRAAGGALGEYNGKFMCSQMVLRGGSCATPQCHIRASYRNFFPPQARWQFMGIRLANDCD